jgi:predicted  nucleic acid-binding Zn-ribbon protein
MSGSHSETTALARLATCDAELYRVRSQRAAVVVALEQQRRDIASRKAQSARRAPSALVEKVATEEDARYAQLVRDFEERLERQAPLLVGLAQEARRIEELRNDCLRALSFRIQTAYAVRVAAGRLPAIACADGSRCGECGHALPAEIGKDDAILICPSCQRLVYAGSRAQRGGR